MPGPLRCPTGWMPGEFLRSKLDAFACAFHLAVWPLLERSFPDCIANIGEIVFEPGANNIVPERAILTLEYRAPEAASFAKLERALLESARATAHELGLELEEQCLEKDPPTLLHPRARQAIIQAVEALGFSYVSMSSRAGHDGQSLADICPVGMIFVPSVGGASHSARELTEWQDCVNGANWLLQAVLRFSE